jgi:hypothetical protein
MKLKKPLFCSGSMSESHWWYLFHKEVKSSDSTTWFRILTIPNPGLKAVQVPSNAFRGCTVRFLLGGDRGFLNERAKTYSTAQMSPLNSSTFIVFTSTFYWSTYPYAEDSSEHYICLPFLLSTVF